MKQIAEGGAQACSVVADVTTEAGCESAVMSAVETWGGLGVLVNNVGLTGEGEAVLGALGVDDLARNHLEVALRPVPAAHVATVEPNHDRAGRRRCGEFRLLGGAKRHDVLAVLIDDLLVRQFLRQQGPKIEAAEVDKGLASLEAAQKAQGRTLADYLKESNQTEAQVDGATVGEALDSLYTQHGELRQRIADDGGSLRRFVNVYLGGEDIRFLDGLETPVKDGDELTILPAVAGG